MQWIQKLLQDKRGDLLVEFLILTVVAASTAFLIVNDLTPGIKTLHENAVQSILNVTGSGF